MNAKKQYSTTGLKSGLISTIVFISGNFANAGVTATVDPGAVGSTFSEFSATVTLTEPTIDFVEIVFEDMKFLKVTDSTLIFKQEEFGSPPGGGNSTATYAWGFLDETGTPIFMQSKTDLIGTGSDWSFTPVPGTVRVYGFFATWDPEVFVQAGISQVEFEFELGADVTVGGPAIDIKPGSKHNNVNPRSNGKLWVAILSDTSAETPFDPLSQIDISTVEFGPEVAAPIGQNARDTNDDGLGDLLLQFNVRETGIGCETTEAELTAETFDARQFGATDLVHVVGCK
jgi:hypothetical protein